MHLLETDTLQHAYGSTDARGVRGVRLCGRLRGAHGGSGAQGELLDRITFIVTSDHGFTSFTHLIAPNVALAEKGLLTVTDGHAKGSVWFLPEGGETSLYIHDDAKRTAIVAEMKEYFASVPGVSGIYTNEEAQKLGIPALGTTDQAPDLYLTAKPGYAFVGGTEGPIERDVTPARGGHGYLNTEPDMQALFIASGAHIRKGVDLGAIDNLRVAPTIAKILGVELPAAKEPPLTEALQYRIRTAYGVWTLAVG